MRVADDDSVHCGARPETTPESDVATMISLLRALLAAVEGRPSEPIASFDPAHVLEVARRHRLSPLLSTVVNAGVDPSLAETLRRDRLITTGRNLMLEQVAEQCTLAMTADAIPLVLLKGLSYNATIYSAAGVRPMSDVDILVPADRRRQAFAVLDRLGFEPRAAAPGFDDADYHEVAWTRGGVEVDLHLALAPLARCHVDYGDLWARVQEVKIGRTTARTLHRRHAAVFHALHMAIDHFDVPAMYLVDLRRLLPTAEDVAAAGDVARAWGVWRPFATATALTTEFLPTWTTAEPIAPARFAARVVSAYGEPERVPRREQLLRKFMHFDRHRDAFRYLVVQGRRNVRELYERHVRRRSARQRLALKP
jgi:hypothetical protein